MCVYKNWYELITMLDHEWTLKHNTNHISERAHEGRLLPPRLRHQVQQENLLISLRLPRWGIIPCQSWQSGLFAQTNNGFVSHSSPRAEAKVRSAITGREQTNLRLLCRNKRRQGLAGPGLFWDRQMAPMTFLASSVQTCKVFPENRRSC